MVTLETDLDAAGLQKALNGNLPRDVVVLEVEPCGEDFDPRRQAKTKSYLYAVWNGPLRSPLRALDTGAPEGEPEDDDRKKSSWRKTP